LIVLDAYAVLALLKDEPAAEAVQLLLGSDDEAALTVLGVAEVLDHLVRLAGAEEDEAALDLAQLPLRPPLHLDAGLAMRAAFLRARQYHRRNRAISLADCVVAEAARGLNAPVATADPHLLDTCRAEGIASLPLPAIRG
jgi:PIN domain nuclease of toxin-antitoxin system